jgi:hypothetical protein
MPNAQKDNQWSDDDAPPIVMYCLFPTTVQQREERPSQATTPTFPAQQIAEQTQREVAIKNPIKRNTPQDAEHCSERDDASPPKGNRPTI